MDSEAWAGQIGEYLQAVKKQGGNNPSSLSRGSRQASAIVYLGPSFIRQLTWKSINFCFLRSSQPQSIYLVYATFVRSSFTLID